MSSRFLPFVAAALLAACDPAAYCRHDPVARPVGCAEVRARHAELAQAGLPFEPSCPGTFGTFTPNGRVLEERSFCSDVCPDAGRIVLAFEGVTTPEDCDAIGGRTERDPAWGGFVGCVPACD